MKSAAEYAKGIAKHRAGGGAEPQSYKPAPNPEYLSDHLTPRELLARPENRGLAEAWTPIANQRTSGAQQVRMQLVKWMRIRTHNQMALEGRGAPAPEVDESSEAGRVQRERTGE